MRIPVEPKASQGKNNLLTNQQYAVGAPVGQMLDNRQEAVAQRKIQAMADNSVQTRQLKALQQCMESDPHHTQFQTVALPARQAMSKNTSPVSQSKNESSVHSPLQSKEAHLSQTNLTGLPTQLKLGIESLSGISLDQVRVHYNSSQPAQLKAHAFAEGHEIHLAPGQERHLPHEAWHVVQQAQGRVRPTRQMKSGVAVNDDRGLEAEADIMGAKAMQIDAMTAQRTQLSMPSFNSRQISQCFSYSDEKLNHKRRKAKVGLELAFNDKFTSDNFGNDGYKISTAYATKEAIEAQAMTYQQSWIAWATTQAALHPWGFAVTQEPHPQGDEHIFGSFGRTRFTYTNLDLLDSQAPPAALPAHDVYEQPQDMSQKEHGKWTDPGQTPELAPYHLGAGQWWWGLTIDPAVFELQSSPTSWQVINNSEVRTVLTDTIFAGAASLGLTADKGMGGGQINIDFQTGLDGDYAKALETIKNLEEKKEDFENSNLDESDNINAPYIYGSSRVDFENKDKPVEKETLQKEWRKIYTKYKKKPAMDKQTWEEFLVEHSSFLRKYPSAKQREKNYLEDKEPFFTADAHQDDIFHFQAVNVGHLSEDDENKKRLEFRDLRAQASVDEILRAIDLCFSTIPDLEP
jgi:hypothetical protein